MLFSFGGRAISPAAKSEGRFEFSNLYVGAYTFHVAAERFEVQDAQPMTAGTQNA